MKKISNKKFKEIMKSVATPAAEIVTIGGVEVEVKRSINCLDMANFIDDAMGYCFQDVDGKTVYVAVWTEFGYRMSVVEYFTNINTDVSADEMLAFCFSGAYMNIISVIDNNILDDLWISYKDQIKYRQKELLKASKVDDLLDAVLKFVETSSVDVGKVDELIESINGLAANDSKVVAETVKKLSDSNGES